MTKKQIDAFKEEVRSTPNKTTIDTKNLLSTGSTQLNLALSGKPTGGIAKGHYVLLVGRSGSGKTWCSLSLLAEACINPEFADYRLIYDPIEDGAVMDMAHYFGKLSDRIEPPNGTKDEPEPSDTVEKLYATLDRLNAEGKPYIYVVDSMDGLSSLGEVESVGEKNKAVEGGKAAKGTYGMTKQKENSSRLRVVRNGLTKTKSILVVICQTRDNIGFGAQFNPDTHGGGNALTFYAHTIAWTKATEQIKVRVGGKDRQTGMKTKIKVSKNRLTGKLRTVEISVLHGLGIDDVGSMIDFLVDEGSTSKWTEGKSGVNAPDFDVCLKRDDLIRMIEENGKEKQLRRVVAKTWATIEEQTTSNRKNKYNA